MNARTLLGGSLAGMLLATTALAETTATASVDLNMRSGPGPTHDVVSVIAAGSSVTVDGCLDTTNWCQVRSNGTEGWAHGDYLDTEVESTTYALSQPEARTRVTVIERQETGGTTAAGGAAGAIVGALIGGPPGAILGAAAGLGAGAMAEPTTREVTYVRENPVETIFLDGEVVVGAQVPDTVVLTPVPDSEFQYAYVNHVPVIVEPQERRIIYITR